METPEYLIKVPNFTAVLRDDSKEALLDKNDDYLK